MIMGQSLKNHLRVSTFTLVVTLALFLIWGYFNFEQDFLLVVGLFHLFFTIPAIYLHIEYYIINKGEEIEIDHNEIVIRKDGETRKHNCNDISKIIVYKSASLDKRGIPFTAIESYYYARLITKSGDEIIITCLLTPKLDEILQHINGINYERKKRFFCSVFWK